MNKQFNIDEIVNNNIEINIDEVLNNIDFIYGENINDNIKDKKIINVLWGL